jgi:hypothetical protein
MTPNEQHETVVTLLKAIRSDAALIARQIYDMTQRVTRMEMELIELRALVHRTDG